MSATRQGEEFIEEFATLEPRFAATAPAWLFPLRKSAIERFRAHGFPTRRSEEWLYTGVASILREPLRRAAAPARVGLADFSAALLEGVTGPRLVFVDGVFRRDLSRTAALPPGTWLGSLSEALAMPANAAIIERAFGRTLVGEERERIPRTAPNDHAFQMVNTACFTDGACVIVGAGEHLAEPVQVVYVASGEATAPADRAGVTNGVRAVSHPRSFFLAGPGGRATIIETYVGISAGAHPYLTNAVTELVVERDAQLDHYKIELEQPLGKHIGATRIRQSAGARLATWFCSFGAGLVRNEIVLSLEGERCDSTMNGIYVAGNDRHVDNHTHIYHVEPRCHSREVYKGIVGGRAHGVFSGKIYVHEGAQKTDAKQSNHALLLSPDAMVHTRPRLEIYADDVRCTHGATVGQLDADALFYARSRGIPEPEARDLLTRAFAADLVADIPHEAVRGWVESLVASRLPAGAGAGATP